MENNKGVINNVDRGRKNRDIGLDITRIIAFISVPAIHFFLNSGYYDTPVKGERMYIMTLMRTFFCICVPLFMLLTGYLMSNKEIEIEKEKLIKYFARISKILLTYIIATIVILVFKQIYLGEIIDFRQGALNILGYMQYSWYVGMYIGCYLLIPFLNTLWKAIPSKEGHGMLVGTFMVLTVLPSIFNYNLSGGNIGAIFSENSIQLVPDWWSRLYPITYYYIGAYLRSYINLKKISTLKVTFLLLCSVVLFGLNNIIKSYAHNFVGGVWCDWGSAQDTVETILMFLLINSINYKSSKWISKIITYISGLTFGAYILSWIPDNVIYPELIKRIPIMQQRLEYFPVCVGMTIIIALILSFLVEIILKKIRVFIARNVH